MMSQWNFNIDAWPGPDRTKWPGLLDIVQESPDGRHAAVVYSCGEVGVCKEIGHFALFAGPPQLPRLLLRPRRLTCLVFFNDRTVQWIGGRFCVVTPYGIRNSLSGAPLAFGGTLYLDVEQRKAAYAADFYPAAAAELPAGLAWRAWAWLSLWPIAWR